MIIIISIQWVAIARSELFFAYLETVMSEYEYKGFEITYIDNPTIGHWEVSGSEEEFESDLDAMSYIDNMHLTLEAITEE